MSARGRIKRPRLERTEPNRSWGSVFGSPPPGPAGAADPIRRGVELGYRVIEDYLQAGQSFARSFTPGAAAPPAPPDLAQLTERMFRYASDFASVWLEAMGMMVASGQPPGPLASGLWSQPPPPQGRPNGEPAATAAPAPAAAPRLSVVLDTRRPAEAEISLDPGPLPGRLTLEPLASKPGDRPLAAKLRVVDGAVQVVIAVGARQRAGTYQARLLEQEGGRPVGRVSVKLG